MEVEQMFFFNFMVSKLHTCITTPEEEILTQDSPGSDMFFISQGDCAVNIIDKQGETHVAVRLLSVGNHFGEISTIYGCKRTSTVISRNYNTMARISQDNFHVVATEFPEFEKLLKMYCFRYFDIRKEFLQNMLHKVEFLRTGLTLEVTHEVIFSL